MIRLLFVDDDAQMRRLFARMFQKPEYQVDLADNGMTGLALLEANDYDAVISDFRMPTMDGGEFLARACDRRPDSGRILVTGESDFDVAVRAVNRGEVFRLVRKPWDDDDLQFAVRLAVDMRRMRREREEMLAVLDDKTESLARINDDLQGLNEQLEQRIQQRTRAVVDTLVAALDYRDPEASTRARRIAAYAHRLGEALGVDAGGLVAIEHAALLHDVGRLGIRDDLYFKQGALTDGEWAQLREHPVVAWKMLRPIEFLDSARRIVLHHRESWDGRGFPAALAGEEICIGARIFAVAEVIDNVLGDPDYGAAAGLVVARAELSRGAARTFDPIVVAAFLDVPARDWAAIRDRFYGEEPMLLEVA